MSEDPGDRYANPLSYLISTKEETKENYDSPLVTEDSVQDLLSLSSDLNSILETTTHIINSEYRHRNSSQVFTPPPGFGDSEVSEKIYYVQTLTQALSSFLLSGKFLNPNFQSKNREDESPGRRGKKDVIAKLINCQEGVILNSDELKQLSSLLIGSTRDGSRSLLEKKATITKSKLDKKKLEFKSITEENKKLNNDLEKLSQNNSRVKKIVKKYKQKIRVLEKELVFSKEKCDKLTSQCSCLRQELLLKRKSAQDPLTGCS